MDNPIDHPNMPGYVSVKEAAQILNVSDKRVYFYIEVGRLPAVWAADVLMIKREDIENFKRRASGRERKINPLWRFSTGENTQYMTTIHVRMRAGKGLALQERLRAIKSSGEHLFPGTIARYISSGRTAGHVLIVLVWRGSIMPDEQTREKELAAFREALADVLDWETAHYDHGAILMHT